jgi:leucine dehydrogenase
MDDIAKLPEFDNHELVSLIVDEATGLYGFIAIHNINLGPAVGGTRYWHYSGEHEALKDVLRLSRAMTYKCALAGVPYGGGKAVILGSQKAVKDDKFLKAYGRKINLLKGGFFTGEDVGVSQSDVDKLAKYSSYIIGHKGLAGDPSPWAALGVFNALLASVKEIFGNDDLQNRTIAIKGLGKVGFQLAQLIASNGGKIVAADINPEVAQAAAKKIKGLKLVHPKEIHRQKVDIYSPNALGAEINEYTMNGLRCHIVCGGANNQLQSDAYGSVLQRLGILYIPDYIANAGGLINVVAELDKKGYSKERVRRKVLGIRETVTRIIALAKEKKKPTNQVADELGRQIFHATKS